MKEEGMTGWTDDERAEEEGLSEGRADEMKGI